MKKKALGQGLNAFLPEDYGILKGEKFMDLAIDKLKPNPDQPRTHFDPDSIEELARSIKETGILQPVVVVPDGDFYKIIVGERRWRAAQKAGLKKIPSLIRNFNSTQQYEASLIENLQREDLNPMEIAAAYQKMAKNLHLTQEEIAEKVGKQRASVANYIRLLKLPPEIQKMLLENKLSMGHARALINLESLKLQISLANQIFAKGLSVRTVESMINKLKRMPDKKQQPPMDPNLLNLQEEFIKTLGTKVSISGKPDSGSIRIFYFSLDELNRIYEKIKGESL